MARCFVTRRLPGDALTRLASVHEVDVWPERRIVVNAKCQRPGVCNAAESLLVHAAVAAEFLPRVGDELRQRGVELRGCERTQVLLEAAGIEVKPATEEDHAAEFLDLILSIKVVEDLDDAQEFE